MLAVAILLTGYSIFSAIILAFTHFNSQYYPEQPQVRVMGILLVLILAGLQLVHFLYLYSDLFYMQSGFYLILLFSVAPAFYLFSKPLLKGTVEFHPTDLIHLLPVIVAPWLTISMALPLSFTVGAAYLLWLAHSVYALREQRSRFNLEIAMLSITFIIAVIVLIIGFTLPIMENKLFFSLYSSSIGGAFIFINLAIALSPQLPSKIVEAAEEVYTNTTLANINCDEVMQQLSVLMKDAKVYEDPRLNLNSLASRLDLSGHQLSELINTRLGKGFSRYIREQRVEAAKAMLIAEPSASVLSVGLSVGFTSQSNFYDAFREITGMTPGKYRKINISNTPK